jgi:enamine deaminase RidA (YjgF/YER057c/UK114 family)
MHDEYRPYVGPPPPARAPAVAGLMGPSSALEIQVIASAVGRRIVGPAVAPSLPLSTAVQAGDLLFLSGVLGNTEANTDDITAQTREVFARIRRTLDTAGLAFDHVVDNLIYVTDTWKRSSVEAICREHFPAAPPASTLVGAKLVTRSGLVEMMMTAAGR